jgi:hypothetical protein
VIRQDRKPAVEAYRNGLLTAALDYYDRLGWVCLPVSYRDGGVIPPVDWQEWAKQRPGLKAIRELFHSRWDELDAIALIISTADCCLLDIDDRSEIKRLTKRAAALPYFTTSRGVQYLLPLGRQRPGRVVNLRHLRSEGKALKLEGEIRDGLALSILPPSPRSSEA